MLTLKQRRLVQIMEYRSAHGLPTVQRDVAEAMGIRRDSLNKLLSRTRKSLAASGRQLRLPPRTRPGAATLVSLSDELS